MSHEIDDKVNANGEVTGKATFYVNRKNGDTPWHRLGTSFGTAPDLNTALEAAGQNFEVEKRPLYIQPTDAYGFTVVEGHEATVRTDRNTVLGIVSDRYSVLQNHEAFSVLEPMLDDHLAYLETGGTLRGGQDVWMLVKFDPSEIAKRVAVEGGLFDEIDPYGLIWNNHAGRSTVMLLETPIRVVCANTLAIALGGNSTHAAKVRHTGNVAQNVKTAADLVFGRMSHRFSMFDMQRTLLQRVHMNNADFNRLIAEPFVRVREFEKGWQERIAKYGRNDPKSTRAEKAFERSMERRDAIRHLWENGVGHTGDKSAWEAYNGFVQALDHDPLFQRQSKTQAARLRRQQETVKQSTLRRVLKYSAQNGNSTNITPNMQRMLSSLNL